MKKLHDSSVTKTTLNEMEYTSHKKPRKKSKPNSMDEEVESLTTEKKKICKTRVTENESGYYLGILAIFLGYIIGSATAMNTSETENNSKSHRTTSRRKDTLKLIFGAYIVLNILVLLSGIPKFIKKIIIIFCIINLVLVVCKTDGNMTVKETIRQGWAKINKIETGSLRQLHITIDPVPANENKQNDNMQSQERLKQDRHKCMQTYLSNTSRIYTKRKNHLNYHQ